MISEGLRKENDDMPTNMEMERRSRSNVCCAISRGSPVPVNKGYTHKPRLINKQTVAGSYAEVPNSYQQAIRIGLF